MSTSDGLPTGSEGERETRTEYLARKMGELASAVREAANRLPDVPISGEVVAAAGIYATANMLDEVRAALAGSGEREPMRVDAERVVSEWDQYNDGASNRHHLGLAIEQLRSLLASAPLEAESKKPARTEVYDGVRGLFVDADAVPDVVMCNGARFVPDLPETIGAPKEAQKHPTVRERAVRIADAVSDAIWGGESGWMDGDIDALIQSMRDAVRVARGAPPEASEEPPLWALALGCAASPTTSANTNGPVPPVESGGGER